MKAYDEMSDEQLMALEEELYDLEAQGGLDTWYDRDQVLWEMNRRGLIDRTW